MNDLTQSALSQLEAVEWFRAIGQQESSSVIMLSSWEEVIEVCANDEWENVCLEAANQHRERIAQRSNERLNQWNSHIQEIKPVTESLVMRKINQSLVKFDIPDILIDGDGDRLHDLLVNNAQWDILHYAMECEYLDLCPVGFYAHLAEWYIRGHFPCGWKGSFPNGQLIIY